MKIGVDYTGISTVFFCHDGNGNFLFAKRSVNCRDEHGRWDVGGGKLELQSTAEDNVRAEVKEEYCADALQIEFLGYRDAFREQNGVKTHWIALDFKVLVDPTQVKIGEPHKFDELGWFTLKNLPSPVHSQLPIALKNYKEAL